jgi:RNA polymerase sigma factor (sigma-70 family)
MGEMDRRTADVTGSEVTSDAELYRQHAPELVRFAAMLVGDDAEDVVASAFARCMSAEGWSEVENHRAYLFRAATNEARTLQRSAASRRLREQRLAADGVVEVGVPRPEVWEAVESLSIRQRAVVYLTYWHDMSDVMVAELLGIGPGSVRRHLARARDKLRKVLHD